MNDTLTTPIMRNDTSETVIRPLTATEISDIEGGSSGLGGIVETIAIILSGGRPMV